MAEMRCVECGQPLRKFHLSACPKLDSLVKNEDCATDQMISEAINSTGANYLINSDGSASRIEAEVPPTSGPVELSLGLSDHLHFEDKL